MGTNSTNILAVNAGSSSLKLVLFSLNGESDKFERSLEISIANIGQSSCSLHINSTNGNKTSQTIEAADQAAAIPHIFESLHAIAPDSQIDGIGHRIVHGGPKHSQPELITQSLYDDLEEFANYDPEHLPFSLQLINEFGGRYPHTPQIACFDSAFFGDMPKLAKLLPLPRKYEAEGLRRYGFHGLSYTYLQSQFRQIAGEVAVNGRVIYAHLGNGVSLAATNNGKPVETTMGFSPSSGVMMSSRSGDIDPSIALYLQKRYGVSAEELGHIINYESGLLGVSGLSSSMLSLLENESDNPQAADAVALFVYQVQKNIGALAATIGGVDSIIFSGGIGEDSPIIRSRICAGLGFLGVEVDSFMNEKNYFLISSQNSRVGVHVIPTDEASTIVDQVYAIIIANNGGGK